MASLGTVFERAFSARFSPRQSVSTSPRQVAPAVLWTLRVVVALQCLGTAWAARVHLSTIGEMFFFEWGAPEQLTVWVEQFGMVLMVASAAAILAFRARVVAVVVAVWTLLLAATHWYIGGAPFSQWAFSADAVRYLAPVALAMLTPPARGESSDQLATTVEWLLRAAAAATFVTHGLEALNHHPRFVDYLLVASQKLLGYELAEPVARRMLTVIGTMDVSLAVLVLARPKWRGLLLWMAFWGVVTAASRIVFGGWGRGYMTLVRIANGGVPLVLWMWAAATPTRKTPNPRPPRRHPTTPA